MLACLNESRSGFNIVKYLDARAKSAIELLPVKQRSSGSVEDTSGIVSNPVLLRRLREWRNRKADESGLPHYMILPQKTMVTLVNFLPQSLRALKQVKGMGTKKTEKYGEELLDLITSYCSEENIEAPEIPVAEKKKPKKEREDTKKITFGLFSQGLTIPQIAKERNLSIATIEGHLSHYVRTGDIPVGKLVSGEIIELISTRFEAMDDLKMGPVKEALGDRVTWSDIRFVANHLTFVRGKAY